MLRRPQSPACHLREFRAFLLGTVALGAFFHGSGNVLAQAVQEPDVIVTSIGNVTKSNPAGAVVGVEGYSVGVFRNGEHTTAGNVVVTSSGNIDVDGTINGVRFGRGPSLFGQFDNLSYLDSVTAGIQAQSFGAGIYSGYAIIRGGDGANVTVTSTGNINSTGQGIIAGSKGSIAVYVEMGRPGDVTVNSTGNIDSVNIGILAYSDSLNALARGQSAGLLAMLRLLRQATSQFLVPKPVLS